MMKQVDILLHTRQTAQGDAADFSQRLSGTLQKTEDGLLLRYTETDENGLTTDNSFLFGKDSALLRRTGAVGSEMRFLPGCDTIAPYHTFYGTFDFLLHTDYFRHTLCENGGKAMLRYTLSAQGSPVGEYTLKLHITEKDD